MCKGSPYSTYSNNTYVGLVCMSLSTPRTYSTFGAPFPHRWSLAAHKIQQFQIIQFIQLDVDDDHLMNKCRNAIVLTRVELYSKDGSTHVQIFAITLILMEWWPVFRFWTPNYFWLVIPVEYPLFVNNGRRSFNLGRLEPYFEDGSNRSKLVTKATILSDETFPLWPRSTLSTLCCWTLTTIIWWINVGMQ